MTIKRKPWTAGNEAKFQAWYKRHARNLGLTLNPDDKRHHYNYRGAYKAGAKPDKSGHWPSRFKEKTHPKFHLQ